MDTSSTEKSFHSIISNPVRFRLFLLTKLPAAYFSGLRVKEFNDKSCIVTVPYKWFTKNPFRSTYFACLSMAAEMSTGILAMSNIYKRKPRISMLVTGIEGKFHKKASGITEFLCSEGNAIKEAINNSVSLNSSQTVKVLSSGYNPNKELVAEFFITWSFKPSNN
ncbi:MAG TPA: DUF4442 domain-containing protein [Flavisolibacter sp.]|nr:DUF4442 domain-containing protein [Flavisolibacter sp.]